MFMRKMLLALIMSLATGAAMAAVPITTIDHPIEIRTDCLILPGSAVGTLTCGNESVQLTADTTYWIGNRAVTFTDFARFIGSLIGKPRNAGLVLTLDNQKVKRIYVADEPAAK